MGELLYGTSSWSEKSWVGSFYPDGTKPAEFLAHYATQFRTVEADNTYYRVPSERMVEGWAARTPAGFELAAKFPRSIVHGGDGPRPDPDVVLVPERVGEETERFLGAMRKTKADKGFFITSSRFTKAAEEYARGEGIELVDGERWVAMLRDQPGVMGPTEF